MKLSSELSSPRIGAIPILFVVRRLMAGGAELQLMEVVGRLDRRRFNPRIFVLEASPVWDNRMRQSGIPVICGSSQSGIVARAVICYPRLLRSQWALGSGGIVHFFLPESYLVGGTSSLWVRGLRRVMSRRSLNDYQAGHPLARRMEHWLHRRMDAIIANSQAVVRQLRDEGVPAERLALIYNGVDAQRYAERGYREPMRRKLEIPEHAFVIAQVANLIHYKGHADLLGALARVAPRLPRCWRLLCVGRDGGLAGTLQARAKRLGLEANIRWLGERRDVSEVLAAADLAVSCSHQEGFSNSVLEAMAAGLAVVATRAGGNAEAVVPGSTGLLVQVRDVDAIGEAIAALASDPCRRLDMGREAKRRVARHFSLAACVGRYQRLYEALAADVALPVSAWLDP